MAGLYKDLAVAAWMEGITPEPPDPARAAMAIIVKADQRAADAKKWNLEASVVLAEMVSLESGKGDCDG